MRIPRLAALAAAALPLAFLLLPPGLAGQEEIIPYGRAKSESQAWIGLRAGSFLPGDGVLREVYGSSGLLLGLTAGFDLHRSAGFSLAAGLDAGRFSRAGVSTLSATPASLTLVPVAASLRARFGAGRLAFWLEAGGKIVFYTEDSAWLLSQGSALGFLAGGGAEWALGAGPALHLFVRWSQADEKMDGFTVHLGGWEVGASLVYRFGI
jgi:hypothetical protein